MGAAAKVNCMPKDGAPASIPCTYRVANFAALFPVYSLFIRRMEVAICYTPVHRRSNLRSFILEASVIEPIFVLGIPVDFILFGLTLVGVALFHHHTLPIALAGLAAITAYKLAFTGFKFGAGFTGL